MPLFEISGEELVAVERTNFEREKDLQKVIENNLKAVFNCRFVASEFSTGGLHAGRIDTLAISEDNNPVIIEYKKTESSDLVNQSLFYLYWIQDHKGDFEVAVQRSIGENVDVDWSGVRVICIAPNYKKYDLHAVQVMGADIELWKYNLFNNNSIYLEEVFQATKASVSPSAAEKGKDPVMVEAGKKAAQVRATTTYSFEEHLEGKSSKIRDLMQNIREYLLGLDPSIEEVPKKFYISYKISQNIVCMEPQSKTVKLFLKLDPDTIASPPKTFRDVSGVGHYGTGDSEFSVASEGDFESVKPFIDMAYNRLGAN